MAVLALASGVPALAGPADDTLNVAMARETDFVDRIHTNSRESSLLSSLLYDTLLYVEPETSEIVGLLATSWSWVDELTLEFRLREGVTFHNGEPFNADDVVYTVEFVADPANQLRQQEADFGNIASVEKIDDYTVRVHLRRPDPTAEFLFASRLLIWPSEYTEANGHLIHGSAPVGTGPYAIATLEPGSRYVLRRYDDYFGAVRPVPEIGTISFRVIPEIQTQVAEIMAGGIDLSLDLTQEDAAALTGFPGIDISFGDTTRYFYISMDATGRSGETPLTDPVVRRAIAHALDREAIATRLVGGGATLIDAQCSPAQNLCPAGIPAYAYDPDRARALLAEAGYPDGFSVPLISSSDLRPVGEAIQGYLSQVGIQVSYDAYPLPTWRNMFIQGESAMSVLGWGGGGSFDVGYAVEIFFNQSATDYARDQQITDWVAEGRRTLDRDARAAIYEQLMTRINEQAYTIPLYAPGAVYVMSEAVDFTPPRLDSPDLTWARWAD